MATAQVAPVNTESPQAKEPASGPLEAYSWLQCRTTAEIAVPRFTVGGLFNLRKGSVVLTAAPVANDVPVKVNKILLGWGRFEAAEDRLAIRITELA
jgi:flagellar motor switch/type III secretory pathway protein FliN